MSMTPATRLDIEVEVLADQAQWWPGYLEHWRRSGDTWQGSSGTPPGSLRHGLAGSIPSDCHPRVGVNIRTHQVDLRQADPQRIPWPFPFGVTTNNEQNAANRPEPVERARNGSGLPSTAAFGPAFMGGSGHDV